MTQPKHRPSGPASPNQAHKRQQIIEAAKTVLLNDGLAGCTVRAVADASPLTKSAVHYYFQTIEEIIDAAMASLLADFLDHLRTASTTHTNAHARLTAVIEQYLGAFATQPGYATLWLGYFVTSAQAGRLGPLITTQTTIIELLEDVLRGAGAAQAPARSRALYSYLTGTVLRQVLEPQPLGQLRPEIETLLGLKLTRARAVPTATDARNRGVRH